MRPATIPTLACALFLGAPAFAQVQRSFPMNTASSDPSVGTVTVLPDMDAIRELSTRDQVVLRDVYLPGGELIDLELERIDLSRLKYGFVVDGVARPDLLDGLDISAWTGSVVGSPDSEVSLTFSREGSRGWIQRGTNIMHLMPKPDARGNWSEGSSIFISETSLNKFGSRLDGFCEYDLVSGSIGERTRTAPPANQSGTDEQGMPTYGVGTCVLREAKIALETDYQLFQVFGSLGAETAYIVSLTAASSDRYETQVSTVLTFPYVQFYTNSNDPWSTADNGGSTIDLLYEFQGAWAFNVPAGADVAHFMSGASLGGGVAWLDVLCNDEFNFAVSANINGNVTFPVAQNPANWDFMVFNHELGHNFGSPHTHNYCPPLDQCPPSQYFGACQTAQVCTNQGTIMSYCHLCSGGVGNITTFFHPTAAALMTTASASCLPLYSGISATPPAIVSPTTPTAVSAEIAGSIMGNVLLFYRYNGGSYSSVLMTNTGGITYEADLPVAACSDTPEFYIGYTDAGCGPVTAPADGANAPYTALVGDATISFSDNFNSPNGWTTQNLGASSGQWERGVPVNDSGWDYDPMSDGDGSGSAYLTQNQNGNTDVDGGSVRLFSPILDMSGSNITVSYRYFLRLTNEDGTDRLLLEVSPNGSSGPWTTIANHDTNGGLAWFSNTIDMSSIGVSLGSNMMIRVTANDTGTASIVEAGLDGFEVASLNCGGGGPVSYCIAGPNSISLGGAQLSHVSGAPGGVLNLQINDLPNTPGLLFFGPQQQDQAFGCGRLCITGALVRSSVFFATGNTVNASFDTTGIASSPFNIQYWYRDPANQVPCGSDFNTSNALGF